MPLLRPSDFNFTPRPPCGGRPQIGRNVVDFITFQSTSSVWRTTVEDYQRIKGNLISIHVLRVEDDMLVSPTFAQRTISIHVLRVEDDPLSAACSAASSIFQSKSSVWRTTVPLVRRDGQCGISIHVLRVEDDVDNFQRALDKLISIHVLRVEDDGKNREKSLFALI